MTAVEDICIGAIQTAKAILVGPGHLAAIDDRVDRPVNTCTVIRMDMRQPPVTGAVDVCQRMAVRMFQRIVPQHVIADQIPVPDRIVGRLRGQPITHLGVFHGEARKVLAGAVTQDFHEAEVCTVFVMDRREFARSPELLTVLAQVPSLVQSAALT